MAMVAFEKVVCGSCWDGWFGGGGGFMRYR